MIVTLQRRDTAVIDDVVGWVNVAAASSEGGLPRSVTTRLTPSAPETGTAFDWSGTLDIPPSTGREPVMRLLVEEFETHYSDTDGTQQVLVGSHQDATGNSVLDFATEQVPSGKRCVFQDMIPLQGL